MVSAYRELPGPLARPYRQDKAMYTHPAITAKLVHDRHRDMRADVGSQRLARRLRGLATAPRPARIAPHWLRRAWHPVLELRAHARRPARPAAGAPGPAGPA
jgi:hypothetical protein